MWVVLLIVLGCVFASLALLYFISLRKSFSIKGKHVMITGGSSGIGKSLAAEAIRKGAAVITLVARNEVRLTQAKEELEREIADNSKQVVRVVSADVSDAGVGAVLEKAIQGMGCDVDVLVNCAGITHTATMLETPCEKYKDLWNVNVMGSVRVTKAVLPSMVKRRTGAVLFISSQAGQLGLYGYTAYSTTKYGLRGLAETLKMELKPYSVSVSISFPPDTDTPQLQAELSERNSIMSELASFGTVFQAEQIAREVWSGAERGTFQITHGFDGFLLGTVTAGISPTHRTWDAVVQVLLMGLFRMVALVYMMLFDRVVAKGLAKQRKVQ